MATLSLDKYNAVTLDTAVLETAIQAEFARRNNGQTPSQENLARWSAAAQEDLKRSVSAALESVVQMAVPGHGQMTLSVLDAVNLGLLVYATNPYNAKPAQEPFGFELDLDTVEMEERPGKWNFKYGDHYVKRAIRVPYCYTPDFMKDISRIPDHKHPRGDDFMIRDHFLIGFEGGSGY